MKKPNITAGPWSADKWATGYTVSAPDSHYSVAHLEGCNNAEANAQAIAALPQALDILNKILYASESPSGASCGEANLCQQFKDQARATLLAAGYTE